MHINIMAAGSKEHPPMLGQEDIHNGDHVFYDNYYQAPKPQRSNVTSSSTRPSASTRHKGKEIAKPVTPQSESVSEEDSDPEQVMWDKGGEYAKEFSTPCKVFQKAIQTTNNITCELLQTSKNKTENHTKDITQQSSGQFRNQGQ
ncbi:hypothetical protein Tco_0273033 [Tanacetum coccineum]